MTKKKKTFIIVSISLLIIIVSGFSFVMITGACGRGRMGGHMDRHMGYPWFQKRGMPLFMHGEIRNFMLWRIDKGAKSLDLSKIQQNKYNNLRSKLKQTIDNGLKTRMVFRTQAIAEFNKDNPDLGIIAVNARTNLELMSDSLSENLALFTNFYNSLDENQKRIITNKIKEQMEFHKNSNCGYCYPIKTTI